MSVLARQILELEKINHSVLEFAKLVAKNLEGKQTYIKELLKQLNVDADGDRNWQHSSHLLEIEELQAYSAAIVALDKERKRVAAKAIREQEKFNE